ncbi:MAG: hypothetical protein LBE83_10320 [Propionibacteriaceae bacterium]|nr:hypothetical protein [Propionibacteriaceae bacterium]
MTTILEASAIAGLIADGATVVSDGFTMMGVADEILASIEQSFQATGHPRDLTWVHSAGQSNRRDGLARMAHPGLLKRVVGSHWGLNPAMGQLLGGDEIEAVCLPQGQLTTLFRTIAAGRPGQLSTVGLGTFVDPRLDGGRLNDRTRQALPADHYVSVIEVAGREFLFYKAFALDVAIIRGTQIDPEGNLSQSDDATHLDALAIAQAVHNAGGRVIAQVKAQVGHGEIRARDVMVPGVLVDYAVICSEPQAFHRPSDSYPPGSRELILGYVGPDEFATAIATNQTVAPARLAIGRRALALIRPGDVINLGTGIPGDVIGVALGEAGILDQVHLTVESGTYGGIPLGGVDFGAALHPQAIIPHAQQFDFYNGGGVDITFMGVGQVDQYGNVNVSKLGHNATGCGGFMDIVDGAKRICFLMASDSTHPKYVDQVSHLTFNGQAALAKGRAVFLVTEFYTLEFVALGWRLVDHLPTQEAKQALGRIPFPIITDTKKVDSHDR